MSIPSSSDTNSSSCIGDSFVLPRPCDDLHLHLRDGEVLIDTIRPVIRSGTVDRAIIMPNLQPPVINAKMASEYRERISSTIAQAQQLEKSKHTFTPLMTLYLTDETTPKDITEAKASGIVYACKLYPKGATTHSNQGVSNVLSLMPVFRTMAESGLLLLIHGESTDPQVDIFDRESSFLPVLKQILEGVPTLKIVLEHVTTAAGVEFVKQHSNGQLAATITAHHLLYSRNSLFQGGLQPHLYCLPILKHESDRLALVESIFSPTHRHLFFAGTDSAPHERTNKERSGCAAGCFTAFATVELYLESLASLVICAKYKHDAAYHRQVIEDFLTKNGATFYGLQVNPSRTIQFSRSPMQVPNSMPFGSGSLVPLRFGSTIEWSIQKDDKSDH